MELRVNIRTVSEEPTVAAKDPIIPPPPSLADALKPKPPAPILVPPAPPKE